MGQYRMPFLKTPYILYASQYDEFQLSENLCHGPPFSSGETAYADEFAALTRELVGSLPAKKKHLTDDAEFDAPALPLSTVSIVADSFFSSSCYNHAVVSHRTHLAFLLDHLPHPSPCAPYTCGPVTSAISTS